MSTLPNETTLRAILELACRAPSVHNTQPWAWVVRDTMLLLRADPHRPPRRVLDDVLHHESAASS